MNPYKIFVESMQQAGIDQCTIDAVAAIHNAIYEAAENDSDDDEEDKKKGKKKKDEEPEEPETEFEAPDTDPEDDGDEGDKSDEEFDAPNDEPPDFEPDESPETAANEPNADEGAKAIMYNILTLMNAKQNAYQQYHWNAESRPCTRRHRNATNSIRTPRTRLLKHCRRHTTRPLISRYGLARFLT